MSRFVIERSHLCGAMLARDGEVDLSAGEVRECAIGVCVQVEGYDVGRLMSDVRFTDNGVNLQATSLPIPDPADPAAP